MCLKFNTKIIRIVQHWKQTDLLSLTIPFVNFRTRLMHGEKSTGNRAKTMAPENIWLNRQFSSHETLVYCYDNSFGWRRLINRYCRKLKNKNFKGQLVR